MDSYCFDFVNKEGNPVNTPFGWTIYTIPDAASPMPSQKLLSMEVAMGVTDILPGLEKYFVSEGLRFSISIPNESNVIITVPRRMHNAHGAYQSSAATGALSACLLRSFC
jgi:hypothetical protein